MTTELRLSPGAPAPPVPPRRGPREPAVKRGRRRFSVVWLVPLVAAAIAAWLAVTTLREQGPTVSIVFKTAEGLEAGKTKVRYKDIEVGTVQDLRLSDDLKNVVAVAELRKQVEPFVTEGTRWWVVRPRVGASGVSGLGTLISGAYIGLDPGRGERTLSFTGLEEPPPMTSDVPGRRFALHADGLGSVDQGSPVYYRGLRVGRVLGRTLDDDRRSFTFEVFVDAPHDRLVRDASRFWNASGIDVSVSSGGVEVATESLQSILAGGVAFDTPGIEAPGEEAAADHAFPLHESRRKVDEPVYTEKVPYLVRFEGSVGGLHAGSPVQFNGIPVGAVTDVRLEYDAASRKLDIPVALTIEPQRIAIRGGTGGPWVPYVTMRTLVAQGLRAQLETGNLLTGELVVELAFHPDAPPAGLGTDTGPVPEIPSVPADLESIKRSVNQVLDKVAALPIDQLVAELGQTVEGVNGLTTQVPALTDSLRRTADAATTTLATANGTLRMVGEAAGSGSQLRLGTNELIAEMTRTARSMRGLADYLERHPESLLRGKQGAP
jgi:paraquat-inducible protein B